MVAKGRCQAEGRGKWEVTDNGYAVSFWSEENFLIFDGGNGCTTL